MNFLLTPIQSWTFADVVAFCAERHPEGHQLDYKRAFSEKENPKDPGLAKDFAAFSNARGGLIIIGVQEDSNTGLPKSWDGIDAVKPEDYVHGQANRVLPRPQYEVRTTDVNEAGRYFVLIRIYEGPRAPYYVNNYAQLYVRSGNTTDLASPQETLRLVGKRENAALRREINVRRAEEVYSAAKERFQKQYSRWQKKNLRDTVSLDAAFPSRAISTLVLQPYLPDHVLVPPPQLGGLLNSVRSSLSSRGTWLVSGQMESIPEGGMLIDGMVTHDATLKELQIALSTGFLFSRSAQVTTYKYGGRQNDTWFYMSRIFDNVYFFLDTTAKIYALMSYQGGLTGYYNLTNLRDLQVVRFHPSRTYDPTDILMDSYRWDIEIDTTVLYDVEARKEFFIETAINIAWDFGFHDQLRSDFETEIQKRRWFLT